MSPSKHLKIPTGCELKIFQTLYRLVDSREYWHAIFYAHWKNILSMEAVASDISLLFRCERGQRTVVQSSYANGTRDR